MNRWMDQIENELKKMKKDLRLANDAEEKSRNAMDDLASVLREVAAEASEAKEKLKLMQAELKATNAEKEQLELKFSSLMTECDTKKNEVERLRMEADETLAGWNEKESCLVGCMKKVEEERSCAEAKNSALQEEMRKLRDILKQAMAEAIVAKEAASLAKAENSQLKDSLAVKDTTLNCVARELESLRLSEAATRDALKDYSTRDLKTQNAVKCLPEEVDDEKAHKKVGKAFSFDMRCTGKNRRFEDLVDEKATVRGEKQDNAVNQKGNMSSKFPDQTVDTERHQTDQRHDSSKKKKALVKRFGELWFKKL